MPGEATMTKAVIRNSGDMGRMITRDGGMSMGGAAGGVDTDDGTSRLAVHRRVRPRAFASRTQMKSRYIG